MTQNYRNFHWKQNGILPSCLMNTAKNIIYRNNQVTDKGDRNSSGVPKVSADMPVVELLPRLLESPSHTLSVSEEGRELGLLTETLLLEGLAKEYSRRDDCAIISLRCAPADYSASRIAMAVEDVGFHLLDLWSGSTSEGLTAVSIRVRCDDPTMAVHSLERYGFEVTDVYARHYADAETAAQRLLALQTYLNV